MPERDLQRRFALFGEQLQHVCPSRVFAAEPHRGQPHGIPAVEQRHRVAVLQTQHPAKVVRQFGRQLDTSAGREGGIDPAVGLRGAGGFGGGGHEDRLGKRALRV